MTTTVTIEAHCRTDQEVVIQQYNKTTETWIEEFIQNGEKRTVYAHDTNQVVVFERVQETRNA